VIGCRPYGWIASREGKPVVVTGFEPLDILQSIVMLLRQLNAKRSAVENQYTRVVPWEGNRGALEAMAEVFELRPYFEWRGMGFISQSALQIKPSYAAWDAERRFKVPGVRVTDPKAAQCGEVLKGVLTPQQCKLFGKECTPEHPIGALMVSSEGSCAAFYSYEHRKARHTAQLVTVAAPAGA
jgi:hydrogenase expression/formation protein HypD